METNSEKKGLKNKLTLSKALLVLSILILGISYAWFCMHKEMSTAAWIKTPIVLNIGAGNDHAIKYLDMGDIDVEDSTNNYKDYVFCVYGKPVDNYSLQLAYTTNIAFHYDVYRASMSDSGNITFQYDGDVEHFSIDKKNNEDNKVINGFSMKEITDNRESPSKYQSHDLSYGDADQSKEDAVSNVVDKEKVQNCNEPLYFLAKEDGVSVMKPKNIIQNEYFLDYYVIRVSWEKGTVLNDKETDIVYLTASR